jgi:hypothetical protein
MAVFPDSSGRGRDAVVRKFASPESTLQHKGDHRKEGFHWLTCSDQLSTGLFHADVRADQSYVGAEIAVGPGYYWRISDGGGKASIPATGSAPSTGF